MDRTKKKKLRSVELEILDEIVRICEKYDITYFLGYGTLLGAVRHKGFIPWDDDVDILMPRNDYNKFKKICKNELNSKYFLQTHETEPSYWQGISRFKVRKNDTLFEEPLIANLDVHKGIFVDIFTLDHTPNQKSLLQDIHAILYQISKFMMNYKKTNISRKMDEKYELIKLSRFISFFFKSEQLLKLQEKIVSNYKDRDSQYYIHFGGRYSHRKKTIPKDVFHPPTKVEFEGNLYNAPNDYDKYLTRIYGENYMELPPEEKRRSHEPEKVIV